MSDSSPQMLSGNSQRAPLRELVTDAIRYWEPRRIIYNVILAVVVAGYFFDGLPYSRTTLTLNGGLTLFILAVLANACYCAAYAADIFAQFSGVRDLWRKWRWCVFVIGTVFAAVLARFFALGAFVPPFQP